VTYGGVEGGGTTFVCAAGEGPDDLVTETIQTADPASTLGRVTSFFAHRDVAAIGLATFGPLDLDPASPGYGTVTAAAKPGWEDADVTAELRTLGVPIAVDTDVNGAAIGEWRWGAAVGLDTFLYVTVGTGIGGGGLVNGSPLHGRTHPEMGHIRVPRHSEDEYPGGCRYHGDCLEGLAAGPAIAARWGLPAEDLVVDLVAARDLEAFYLGTAMANLTLTLSPRRIILGGGVMGMPGLLDATRTVMVDSLAGYSEPDPEAYLVPPALPGRSGVLGAIAMAMDVSSG
jgi:fructokinase